MANILTLDPQVQIRIIDLAWEWATKVKLDTDTTAVESIKKSAERFDQAFKAILKTFLPEQTDAPAPSVSNM